ncbi:MULTISPECIES: type II and III secretion system protein family protein [unclassified Devosia]|uniref:type II and III secretion system protein family protein n=1 Tax=unclassified Devosia TaxID=196773 RepID=UPI001AD01F00|nr:MULTISPECIES: type II and III secretion system protein family protein [unclassified Devosia]MBN9304508.1 type II and III secretion system protein family protein [Devosia sp.]
MTSVRKMNRARLVSPRRLLLAVVAAGLCLAPVAAWAQQIKSSPTYIRVADYPAGVRQQLVLDVNKSTIIDLPTSAGEVIASQPAVAAVVMRTKTRAIVQAVAGGDTNILFLDGAGNNIATFDVKVVQPRSDVGNALEAAIARNLPGSHIRVESVTLGGTNRVVLSGSALSQDDVDKAKLIAVQFAGGADNVASIVNVAGNQQVMLKVTVAEVDRTAIKQLGLDLNVTASGGLITGLVNTPNASLGDVSGGSPISTVTAGANIGPLSISATLKALARRNALRTLAEPTLTAFSGQPAEFLVGGEVPYTTSDGNGHVITAFKEYGVKLNFTPTVKSNGNIGLIVDTNVSEPAGGGAVTERGAKTTVEIPAGCTLAIGGLLQENEKHELSQMPGLGDIPILGALFRSRDYVHQQTELVIMVTPVMAEFGRPQLPTDNYAIAGDAEAIFLGHLEKQYGVGNNGMRGSYQGSVGFILD